MERCSILVAVIGMRVALASEVLKMGVSGKVEQNQVKIGHSGISNRFWSDHGAH